MEILLVEDNPGDARLLEELLQANASLFTIKRAPRLSDAMECIAAKCPEVVLLDLGLPDSQGLATLRAARKAAPEVPIVIMTGRDDEELGVQAVKEGAQDYLVKGRVGTRELAQSLRYALERQRLQAEIESARRHQVELEKSTRRRLESVLDCLPVMVCLLTPDYQVAFSNRAFRKEFGEAKGRKCYDYCFGRSEPCEFCESFQVLKTHAPHDWEVTTPNGRLIHAFDFPFTDLDGTWLVLEMDMDITEQKRAEDAFARSNAELEQFAYVASHDLQEPLRKIVAFGDRLATHAGDKLDDQGRNYLEHMQHGALRMGQLIDSLLELSRVGTRGSAFEPLNLNKVVPEVLADLEVLLLKAGGRVEVAQLPTLMADRAQMCQLFQNLVINALKFHRRNVPPVVRIFSRKGPDKFWELHVADNGIGFEEVYLDRIFRPFQRLNPRSEYEGSGMGLAICQKIVARHGGQITAHSQPGVGSDFVVTLPAAAHLSKEAKAS